MTNNQSNAFPDDTELDHRLKSLISKGIEILGGAGSGLSAAATGFLVAGPEGAAVGGAAGTLIGMTLRSVGSRVVISPVRAQGAGENRNRLHLGSSGNRRALQQRRKDPRGRIFLGGRRRQVRCGRSMGERTAQKPTRSGRKETTLHCSFNGEPRFRRNHQRRDGAPNHPKLQRS